ncbi:MAG: universal stress protein [Terriglobia bacterium]
MPELKRILCPIDFSQFSIRAYLHALSLAEHYGAKLFVQHVVELWRYPSADFAVSAGSFEDFCRDLGENCEKELQQFLENYTPGDIQPECVVQRGIAPDSILTFAEAQKADLIVMGTHGRRGFDRLMLGSVTERVMRKASCPVLVVHKPSHDFIIPDSRQDAVNLNRILFCTDFSANSRRALDYALSLAAEYGAELTLVHVLENIPPSTSKEATAKAAERLDKLIPLEMHKSGKVRTTVCIGKPYEQIIRIARETQTEMAVMAVRGRSALNLAVFGSTTHRVVQLGPCPVLVVHV